MVVRATAENALALALTTGLTFKSLICKVFLAKVGRWSRGTVQLISNQNDASDGIN